MLTEKDYCDYDTCVALKKLGYNEKTLAYYTSEGFFHWIRAYIYDVAIPDLANSSNKKPYKHIIDAMSLYEAQKWLREEKGYHIEIDRVGRSTGYDWQVSVVEMEHNLCKSVEHNNETYEEALLVGIKASVKILKEK